MRKLLQKSFLLLCALVAGNGSVWAAEGDTHDFTQTLSQLLNNSASISDIDIAAQAYPVKEVIISYTHNKSLTPFVTANVTIGSADWGSIALTSNTTTTASFTGASATGAIKISFTNNVGSGTGKGTFKVTNIRLVEGAVSSTVVSAPSFSPNGGAVEAGTTVVISSLTDDATIYYTMGENPDDPTTSSTLYTGPIAINEATTIKAIGVKDGMENSLVSSASYTLKEVVHGYFIDFEKDIDAYVDWTIENAGIHTSGLTAAHSGSAWASNVNESDNGVSSLIIQTKEKVANPGVFTCYISKESGNTTSSTWAIQVSSDGTNWEDVETLTSMTQNTWKEFKGDIKEKGYTNVYVRLYYDGSTAKRAVDDISLTTYVPITISSAGWATFSSTKEVEVPAGVTVYYAEKKDENTVSLKVFADGTEWIPANTGFVVSGAPGTYAAEVTNTGIGLLGENLLKPWTTAGTPTEETYYTLAVDGGKPVFKKSTGGVLAAGKAYLVMPTDARELKVDFGGETTDVREKVTVNSEKFAAAPVYNLNGQRVSQPSRGLYIVNGKKVVVK